MAITTPLVTVVTPTTGDPSVLRALQSVADQSYKNIQHLIVIDNPQTPAELKAAIRQFQVDVIELPYATGTDRFMGHRIVAASAYLGKGDFFCYLDQDNWFDSEHVASLLDVVRSGFIWSFSFRKIVDRDGNFICNDDCESLGKWPTFVGTDDYHIDANCFFLPRMVAINTSAIWFRRYREPNTMGPDRAVSQFLRRHYANYETSYCYTVNYRVGNTMLSIGRNFFLRGNQKMLEKRGGHLPWKKDHPMSACERE